MRLDYLSPQMQAGHDSLNDIINPQRSSTNMAFAALEQTMGEDFPFEKMASLTGTKFLWTRSFVYKVLWAFATDNTDDMGEQELIWLGNFIEYEEKMSHSLTNGVIDSSIVTNHGLQVVNNGKTIGSKAIGCTLPDQNGKSYVIYEGGGRYGEECYRSNDQLEFIPEMESFDRLLMDMLNDVPNNRAKLPMGELIDVTNSKHDNIKDIDDVR